MSDIDILETNLYVNDYIKNNSYKYTWYGKYNLNSVLSIVIN